MTEMSLAADRPLNWNVLGVTPRRHAREAARRRHPRGGVGRARRRAHAAAGHPDPLVVPHRLRARRAARLARDDRAAGARAHPRAQRPRGARPARRAGALARSGRAREPRALGAARGDRDVHAARRSAFEGRHVGDIAKEQGKAPFDALLDIVVADELRTGLRPNFGGPEPDETWKMRADVWRDPRAMIGGSDAGAHLDMMSGASYSTFVVGDAVRNGYLSLEEAVHLHHRQARAPLRRARPRPPRARACSPTSCASTRATVGPDRRAHARRPARRREPHRRPVAGRDARARERHRDRSRLQVHGRRRPAPFCGPDATPKLSTQHPRRPDVHARIGRNRSRHDAEAACRRRRDRRRPVLAALRRRPGHRVPRDAGAVSRCTAAPGMFGGHSVHVASYADVTWALKHPEVFSSKDVVDLGNDVPLIPLSVDPPDHRKYRRLLDPEFSPTKMAALEPEARALVNEIIDEFADQRRSASSTKTSRRRCRRRSSSRWSGCRRATCPTSCAGATTRSARTASTPEEAEAEARRPRARRSTSTSRPRSRRRRSNPDDRLLTPHRDRRGRRPAARPTAEKLGICHLLLLGGLDTVTATLDCMITYLAQHPGPAPGDRRRSRS